MFYIYQGQILYYVHCSHIYNNQKLETTQMSLNREMDIENVVHLHNGKLLSYIKNNDFMIVLDKWMELENIIFSEVAQSQKNTSDVYSLISGY